MPALNESSTIGSVVQGVRRYGLPLVVDDGSQDDTASIAQSQGAHVVSLKENVGYEGALEAGFAEAARIGADVVVTFDADGQFQPEVVPRILCPIKEHAADIVIGEREKKARPAETLFGLYTGMRYGVKDILCGVKAYRMHLYSDHGRFDGGRSVGTELALAALRSGAVYETVRLPVEPRATGRPRFGSGIRANVRLLVALALGIGGDFRALWR